MLLAAANRLIWLTQAFGILYTVYLIFEKNIFIFNIVLLKSMSKLLERSYAETPIAKCIRVLPFNFVGVNGMYNTTSPVKLSVPFEVKTVKCTVVGISDNGQTSHDIFPLKCSIYDGREIGVYSNGSHENSSTYPAFEFIYQQPKSFQNEIVTLTPMYSAIDGNGNPYYAPIPIVASITLILELSSV